tara:strand:- start:1064 stop:1408 length:345 start_codon:yes stop_codon:yes gene_type:complete
MANQSLNTVQKNLSNELGRQTIEKLLGLEAYLENVIDQVDNQQTPIADTADILNDAVDSDSPRLDAPNLNGSDIYQLRNLAATIRDTIRGPNDAVYNRLVSIAVRSLNVIKTNG